MKYFYRVVKFRKYYYIEFRTDSHDDYDYVILNNYLGTHDIHATGLEYYGCTASFRVSGFRSVSAYSNWLPLNFVGDGDCFYVDFPTNFGYISPRGKFLRTGDFHLRVNFSFSKFFSVFKPLAKNI